MTPRKKSVVSNLVSIRLEVTLPRANTVCVAGNFNDWSPTASPLRCDGRCCWSATLRLPPGQHEYRLVIDGVWCDVPGATETVPNPYGSVNALLSVPPAGRAVHAA